MRILIGIGLTLAVAVFIVAPVGAQNTEEGIRHVAIRAGRLIDGLGGPPMTDAVILIENEMIKAIGRDLPVPTAAEVIDLSRSTVLPGLIDCHTHVTMQPSDYYESLFRRSPIDVAVDGNPLTDTSELERVSFVMKGGIVYKRNPVK